MPAHPLPNIPRTATPRKPARLYGVFIPTDQPYPHGYRWGMTRNLRVARRAARAHPGAEIRWMPLRGAADSWDAPTFRVCSSPL